MYEGMAYDYLTDPTGGQRVYQNPMLSWGMIGLDLGLTMGHGWISKFMKMSETAMLRGRLMGMSDSDVLLKYGPGQRSGRMGKGGARRVRTAVGGTGTINPGTIRAARVSGATATNAQIKALGPKYAKFGAGLRGIGWFAAIGGLADLGFSLMSEMATPGVSREAIDRDRQMLSNSEGMLDTRMAYTQRQRAIQAIHDSQISIGRSMIGQESSYLHR